MFNVTPEMLQFYNAHVRLGADRRSRLTQIRDLNLEKLNRGLDDLRTESGRPRPHYSEAITQGGFAMHTLNQDPSDSNDYDIDVAVVFNEQDLPATALSARQRIRDALSKRTEHMKEEPDLRTNAVTLWYQEGYHVDFAVFRRRVVGGEVILEHASTDWLARDPHQVNRWFNGRVVALSPKNELGQPTLQVGENQLRRIVRFLKWFCKSRESWSLPGGMVMSTLAVECYCPDRNRDDVALYETLVAISNRLGASSEVENPVSPGVWLTARAETRNQILRLKTQIDAVLPRLAPVFDPACDTQRARAAWDWVFNHAFWGEVREESLAEAVRRVPVGALPNTLRLRCQLARGGENGQVYGEYRSAQYPLPKGVGLRFSIQSTDVPEPYEVAWHIQNSGQEAAADDQLEWDRYNQAECRTSTKYKGMHRLSCEVRRHGTVVARAHHFVRIRGRR